MSAFPQKCVEDTGMCIPASWYCNGNADCPQGSDEQNCPCEKYNMVDCLLDTSISICVPESWTCNLDVSCLNYSKDKCQLFSATATKCDKKDFLCHFNEACIPEKSVCDGLPDCEGEEDEVFCTGGLTISIVSQ